MVYEDLVIKYLAAGFTGGLNPLWNGKTPSKTEG